MPVKLFNTLSGKLETFEPQQDKLVLMYSCGPTVYDYGHIGNFRTFVALDILRRFLRQSGYKLKDVMNITDVEDKIFRKADEQGGGVRQYAEKYEKRRREDCEILSLQPPQNLATAR